MGPAAVAAARLALALAFAGGASAQAISPADRLLAGFAASRAAHADNPFGRPLFLDSTEGERGVSGEVYAWLAQPFVLVAPSLARPSDWCEILILHPNTKYCRASADESPATLDVRIGTKNDQPLSQARQLAFAYRVTSRGPGYLAVALDAPEGPLDTRDYRIVLEAVPATGGGTVIRLAYAYGYGTAGKVAMQVYLATAGRNKVGFSVAGRDAQGRPVLVGGLRGVVERNTLRYGLAIEAFYGAAALPATVRREQSLRDWFAATERHPRQLYEMPLGDYLVLKRKESARQRATDGKAPG